MFPYEFSRFPHSFFSHVFHMWFSSILVSIARRCLNKPQAKPLMDLTDIEVKWRFSSHA